MNFSDLNLHPTVAAALAKKGYETATGVQAAVLQPEAAGRDLLVSSQTGSGKTIAFGAALAENLLAPDAVRTGNQRTNPLALVIVPTRELAVQVREELGWLLRETKLRLASFTGGTPVTGDLRTLQKGLDIAIGTPGRLVDLLRRQRLELAEIRVVVLDEADEMLDLGFREDLQTILQAAPATRRTLLLSATLPAEIQALARRFQRDALRIDPRKDGDQTARAAHGDITYVAHLIAGADRLAVVVNILRAAGEGRAIVFCTTREGVSRLHAALLARGFSATAISGDRAQAERDRALEQVRKGDARILVATNVAARGLHLPDVDLIIHADLPLNAESLTHRSGRTGRAGRKGTAVVLASLTERRKAERLLMSAHVPVVWSAPPSPESITAAARERLAEELLQEANAGETDRREDPAAEEMVKRLESVLPPRELARRLLLRELTHLPVGERIHPVAIPGPERRDRFAPAGAGPADGERGGRRPGRQDFAREGAMFRVNIGAKDNADPRWLLPLICRRGGISSRDVGAIRIGPQETVFEISGDVVGDFELSAAERDPRAPHVIIAPLRGGAAGAAPGRSADRQRERPARPPEQKSARAAAPARAAEPRNAVKPVKAAAKESSEASAPANVPVTNGEKKSLPSPPEKKADRAAPGRSDAKPEKKRMPSAAPTAVPAPAAAPVSPPAVPVAAAATSPQPASIFQTRTPLAATAAAAPRAPVATERPGREGSREPLIEMKRAGRLGNPGQRPAAAAPTPAAFTGAAPQRPSAGAPSFAGGAAAPHRRSDGTNVAKRAPGRAPFTPAGATGGSGFGPPRGARPFGDGPGRGSFPPARDRNGPAAGRPSSASGRPGAGPARASAGHPPHGGGAAGGPPRSGSARPPFWKEGARKRPGAPARQDGSGPKGKAPNR